MNDVYGHAEGDKHIIAAADMIRGSFSDIGTGFRTGGDEFIVIAENCSETQAEDAVNRLRQLTAQYNADNDPPVPLVIACGCAKFAGGNDNLEAAEQMADRRMYENKRELKSNL